MSLPINSPMGLQLRLLIGIVGNCFGVSVTMRQTELYQPALHSQTTDPLSHHGIDFIIYHSQRLYFPHLLERPT